MPRKVLVLMLVFLYMHRIDLKSSKAANFLSIFIQIMPKIVRSMEICYKINDKETGLLTLHCMQYNIWVYFSKASKEQLFLLIVIVTSCQEQILQHYK